MNANDLAIWFRRWRKPVSRWLSQRRPPVAAADIDDLAQETFMRLLRYSNAEVINNPQGYLFRIAGNVANEWMGRACNRKQHIPVHMLERDAIATDFESGNDETFDQLLVDETPEAAAERQMERAWVKRAIAGLPDRQRRMLLLHADGLTYRRIAELERVTERLVLRELCRAYSHLRMQLQ